MIKRWQPRLAMFSFVMGVVALGISGCASNPSAGAHEARIEQEAIVTVEAVDVPNRLVTVRNVAGDNITVYVDEANKAFPQVKVGDQVKVRYVESMAFQLTKAAEASKGYEVTSESSRPKAGQPEGASSTQIKTTVKIESVEQSGGRVTFTGPRGRRTVRIQDAGTRDYASKLRPGDAVEVTYKEALALSLEKVKK